MTKLLIALTLTIAAQSSFAQGFAPWEARGVAHEMKADPAATIAPTGFAPWRDRETVMDLSNMPGTAMGADFGSAFRPWS